MNTVLVNQMAGLVRMFGPVIAVVLVSKNLPPELANTIAGVVVEAIVGLVTIGFGYWDWRSNRAPAVAAQAASEPGVKVVVQHNASPEMKQLAADPTQPDIEPAKPSPV